MRDLIKMQKVIDYPKIHCPFKRRQIGNRYVVTPEIDSGFEWVFGPSVRAVDKLHGTNICVNIQGKVLESIDNRDTRVLQSCNIPISGMPPRMLMGVMNACDREWLSEDGRHYGELIGPDINKNIHGADQYYFVPFAYLGEKCHWHSWVQNKYPKDFVSISEWFKELPSLFSKRVLHKDVLTEGLVFYGPNGKLAKLRRDMFDWYEGEEHK